jgi:hypothetical protein
VSAGLTGRGHERARNLAAIRADERLTPDDAAWLADHLEYCDACAAVAADYDAQHDLFADLRAFTPAAPRDLWARTSAAIEAERGRTASQGGWRRLLGAPREQGRLPLAPVVAVVAVVMVVGAGLLNGGLLLPGGAPGPTPIAVTAAADIQVITRDSAGNLQIIRQPVAQVCPVGTSSCGVQPTFAVTAVTGVGSAADLQGALSPTGGQMVVVTRDVGGEGVYVIPVKSAATPAATAASTPPALSAPATTAPAATSPAISTTPPSASASPSTPAASPTPASASPSESGEPATSTPPAPPSPSDTDVASPSPSESPSDQVPSSAAATSPSAPPSDEASPEPTDASEPPQASTEPPPTPTPLPSIEVTPAPDAAIKIASGVTVVGVPLYAPDGAHLAFAAMPSDGSAGPDIYIWAVGDKRAQAITSDHDTWLAGWTAEGILVSRVADGSPATYLLDPASGSATPVGAAGTWLPVVSPDGSTAAWWSGSVKLAADGVTWVPATGKLVLGAWPDRTGATTQLLARGPLDGWRVRWSDNGNALAVWTDGQGNGRDGQLSLYPVGPSATSVDLANPILDAASANPDFSLRTGRLAWTTPSQGSPQVVQVLAWSGKAVGRFQVQADGSSTVIP